MDCERWGWGCDGFGESLVAGGDADCGGIVLEYSFDLSFTVFGSLDDGGDVVGYFSSSISSRWRRTLEDSSSSRSCDGCESLRKDFVDGGLKHGCFFTCLC